MAKIVLLNKPFRTLCQFTDSEGRDTLANYLQMKGVYVAGRLDYDSEGLLLLTDNGRWQHLISDPTHKLEKHYWAQVEGIPSAEAIEGLSKGVQLKDGLTKPAVAALIDEPNIWPRQPPIRERKHIPTAWINLSLREGRNRQVRRMTAAIGHPTLRLVRHRIGPFELDNLDPGCWRVVELDDKEFAAQTGLTAKGERQNQRWRGNSTAAHRTRSQHRRRSK